MMSDFNSWRTPSLTSDPIMGHKRRPPRTIENPGRTGVLVSRNRANPRASVQRKAGGRQELLAGASLNRLLYPGGESPLLTREHRGVDSSGPLALSQKRGPHGLSANLRAGSNGRPTPLQNVPSKAWATAKRVRTPRPLRVVRIPVQPRLGTHSCSRPGGLSGHRNGRQTPIQAQPIWQEPRRLSGLSEATFLGPIGFDTELMGHRACSRRSFRLDQMSNSNCERQRNRRNRASGVSRRWARSPSISAASSHGLAGSNPASNRRDIAGGGGADPLASTAVEASRSYLDQACGRRWLVGFVDRGSIPRGSTSSSPPRSLIRGRATSVNVELIT